MLWRYPQVKPSLVLLGAAAISHALNDTYDYIVIGSGPGGGPLSARLAIAGYSVLLMEAGDDRGASLRYQIPALQAQSTEDESMRWDYYVSHYSDSAIAQKDTKFTWRTPSGDLFVRGPEGKINGTAKPPAGSEPLGILYPRAGTLGGCSAHNALITVYPHKSDWDGIASLAGDATWSADNMRKYFEKLEASRYLPNGITGHGFSGWLSTMVTDLTLVLQDSKLLSLVIAAGTAMGQGILGGIISTIEGLGEVLLQDINADTESRDTSEGVYQVPLSMSDYHRTGSREFILDTANAKNADGSRTYRLDIALRTFATKIQFDVAAKPPKATGVEYLSGQSLYRADPRAKGAGADSTSNIKAAREIIISTGSFNTPQLLKLSGIGPRVELQAHNVPVIVDLPGVGTNLQDRYETSIGGSTGSDFALTKDCTFLQSTPDPCLEQWQNNAVGKGAYGSNGLAVGIVKKSSVAVQDSDLFIAGAPAYFTGYFPGYADFSIRDRKHWVWIILKAASRNDAGTVQLRSSDPLETPLINFNSFAKGGDEDVQAVYEGMQFARNIFNKQIPLDGSFSEVWPGAKVGSEALMKDFIRNEAWGHHACCTAKIGIDGDPMAVLDADFRVRGVQGLRVVDASVFPKIPGFYIAVPVYMISEKAAEVILKGAE